MEAHARCSAGNRRSLDAVTRGSHRRRALAVWVLWVIALVLATPVSATSYVYDANGRLIAVTNDAGESARYVYDVMGNIQRVDRLAADELALFSFTPGRGVGGMQVRLQGSGFSADVGANTVRFGTLAASVIQASTSELTVLVPPAAVTAPISISVGSQSVSSSTDFVVDQSSRQPRIDNIFPQLVSAGNSVSVTGESLYPIEYQSTVRIGARSGVVSNASQAQLDFVVPTASASGKVSVSTPYGMAVSTQDLVVLPAGVVAASVSSFRRIVPDAPAGTFSVDVTGQQVAVLVDATLGEHLDVQFSAISAGNLSYTVYDPANRKIVTGTATTASPTVLLPAAASAGTYLLLIKPTAAPVTWRMAIERSRTLMPGAAPMAIGTTVSGQRKRLVYPASIDQRLGLGVSDLSLSAGSSISISAVNREATLTSTTCYASYAGCQLNIRPTQVRSNAVVFSPGATQTFQAQVSLSEDIQGTLQREVPFDVVVPTRGQNARLYFQAQAGESLALQVVSQLTQPSGKSVTYGIYKPDGTLLKSSSATTHQVFNLPTLPQTGLYHVFMDPDHGATSEARIVLREGGANGGELDGDPGEFETETGGQSVYFNFEVSELDERVGVGISDLVLSSGTYVNATLYRPDGTSAASSTCYASRGGCGLNLRAPMVGRYSVLVQPVNASQTMRLKGTVSRDVQLDMEPEQPVDLVLGRRGQNGRLYFDAEQGANLGVMVGAQLTEPLGKSVTYGVYTEAHAQVATLSTDSPEVLRLTNMAAGRYYLYVDPADGAQAQARITLSAGRDIGLEVDGAPVEYVAPVAGFPAFITFTTTEVEQRLGLALHDIVLSSGTSVSAQVYGPAGQSLGTSTCAASRGCEINIRAAVPGTYSLVVRPQAGQLMQFLATVSNDLKVNLQREVPLALDLARHGQNGRLMFNAEAGDTLALQVSGQISSTASSAVYGVYRPDGTALSSVTVTGFNQLRMMKLPVAGEYMVYVDPAYGATLQSRVVLTAGNGGAPELDGDEGVVVTPVGGQATFATFDVTEVDQRIGIGISELSLSSGTNASVAVYRPNGSQVVSTTCYQSYKGCELNLRAPEVGRYGIVVDPKNGSQVLGYRISVSNDMRRSLPREAGFVLDIPRHGQNAWLSFDAQAGETLGLQISGQSTLPAGNVVNYQVIRPDGVSLVSRTPVTHDSLNLPTLPIGGTYQVFVDPRYGAKVNAQLRLTDGSDSGTHVDGEPVELSTTQPGQPTYLTFQATAGERLGLGISDLVLSTGSNVVIYVYRPGGATAGNVTCTASNGGCVLAFTAADTGIYSVVAMPQTAAQTHAFRVTLSRELEMQLERDTPTDLAITRRGQKARFSFTGQVGEALALQLAAQVTLPAGRTVTYRVYKPDGAALGTLSTAAYGSLDLRLPADGTYQILVDAPYGETLNARMTLASGARPAIGGTPVVIATGLGGQPAYATFQASAGQRLSVGLHDLELSSGTSVAVTVYRPDGASAGTATCTQANQGCKVNLPVAVGGTYSVAVMPQATGQSMTFKLSVSEDISGVLVPDQPLEVVIPRRGQNARLTFNAQAGQWLSLQVAGQVTVPAARTVYYRVYKPDGALLTSTNTTAAEALRFAALPVDGTYSVLVDSVQGETVQARLTLATGNSALTVDGESADVATGIGGQEVFLTFNASAGKSLGIGLGELQLSSGTYFSATLYRPDGGSASATCYAQYGGCELNATSSVAGVYRLYLKPQTASQQMQFKVTVSTDLEVALDKGVPVQLALDRRGRNGSLVFAGLSGESLKLQVNDQLTAPAGGSVSYVVYRPDGSSLTSVTTSTTRVIQLPVLPANGTYRVMVSPTYGATADIGVVLQ